MSVHTSTKRVLCPWFQSSQNATVSTLLHLVLKSRTSGLSSLPLYTVTQAYYLNRWITVPIFEHPPTSPSHAEQIHNCLERLVCIWDFSAIYFDVRINYPDSSHGFLRLSVHLHRRCLKTGQNTSFHIVPNSVFTTIGMHLIIFQQYPTYSVYYISVGSSTCLGC